MLCSTLEYVYFNNTLGASCQNHRRVGKGVQGGQTCYIFALRNRKPIIHSDLSDKPEIENYEMESYTVLEQQFCNYVGVLSNLKVLSIVKPNPDLMKDFFCFKHPNLTSSKTLWRTLRC